MVRYRHNLSQHKRVIEEGPNTRLDRDSKKYLSGNKTQRRKLVSEIKSQIRGSVEGDADIFFTGRKGSDKPRALKEHIMLVANSKRPGDARLRRFDDFLEEHLEFGHMGGDKYEVVLRHPSKKRIASLGSVTVGKHPGYSQFGRASWPIASLFDVEAKPRRDMPEDLGPLFERRPKEGPPSNAKRLVSEQLHNRFLNWDNGVQRALRQKLRLRYGDKSDAYFLSRGIRFGEITKQNGDYGKHAQAFLVLPESRGQRNKELKKIPIGSILWDPRKEGIEPVQAELHSWADDGVKMHLFPGRYPHLNV